jgi:hypothetical protein
VTARQHRKSLVARRPTETVAGAGGFAAVYAALTGAGVVDPLAAALALAAAFVPAGITYLSEHRP